MGEAATVPSGAWRFEAGDARADGRRRIVEVSCDRVVISRSVAGVAMRIALAPGAYRGVVVRLRGVEDGAFRYDVRLLHRDPDLDVRLAETDDVAAIEREWRGWAAVLGVAALVDRGEGRIERIDLPGGPLAARRASPRRRGKAVTARRPRFLVRRKVGRPAAAAVVFREDAPLFLGPLSGR